MKTVSKFLTACIPLLSLLTGSAAIAETLSDTAVLRKISLRTRGILPSDQDYFELKQVSPDKIQAFFAAKSMGYLSDAWGRAKMSERVYEDLRLPVPIPVDIQQSTPEKTVFPNPKATDNYGVQSSLAAGLQKALAQNNWNKIYTTDQYSRLIVLSALTSQITNSLNSQGIAQFIERLRERNVSLNEDIIEKALELFAKDPSKFQTKEVTEILALSDVQIAERFLQSLITQVTEFKKRNSPESAAAVRAEQALNYLGVSLVSCKDSASEPWVSRCLPLFAHILGQGDYLVTSVPTNAKFGIDSLNFYNTTDKNYRAIYSAMHQKDFLNLRSEKKMRTPTTLITANPKIDFFELDKDINNKAKLILAKSQGFEKTNEAVENYIEVSGASLVDRELAKIQSQLRQSGNIESFFVDSQVLSRYSKTRYSRSAAFYRIFLCDEMQPEVIVDESQSVNEILGLFSLPGAAPSMVAPMSPDDHAQGSCIACHRKLEPVQKQFGLNGKLQDPKKAFEFVFDDFAGKEHRLNIPEASQFFSKIMEQDQFVRCQTQKMWNWMMGQDVSLSTDESKRLMQTYRSTNGDYRQVMTQIAVHPDFKSDDSFSRPPTFSTVRDTLSKCNSCHSTLDTPIPSFSQLPFGSDHYGAIKEMVDWTKLNKKGQGSLMPPEKAGWKLNRTEMLGISQWLANGALDDNAKPTLTSEQTQELLGTFETLWKSDIQKQNHARPSFANTWKRFVGNFDAIKILSTRFPDSGIAKCYTNYSANSIAMGFKDILIGSALSEGPSRPYKKHFNQCVHELLLRFKDKLKSQDFESQLMRLGVIGLSRDQLDQPWKDFSQPLKIKIAKQLLDNLIGPEGLKTSASPNSETQFIDLVLTTLKATKTVENGIVNMVYLILNDDHFLVH